MMSRFLVVVWLVSGCISSNPAKGTASTGQPLTLRSESGTGTYQSMDVVGQDVLRDSHGNDVGTIDHVEAREHDYAWHFYSYEQSGKRIDEQDFYRIGGDSDSVERVKKHRRGARSMQKLGWVIVAGSVIATGALMGGGIAIDSTGIALLSLIPLTIGVPMGGIIVGAGRSSMRRQVIEENRAKEVAQVVEDCFNYHCRKEPGGAKFLGAEPDSLSMRGESPVPAAAPPPRPVQTLAGAWRGEIAMQVQRGGVKTPDSTTATILVTDVGSGVVEIDLDPDRHSLCTVRAELRGVRADIKPASCKADVDGQPMDVQYTAGALELKSGELSLDVSATITSKSRGRRERASVSWKGVLSPSR